MDSRIEGLVKLVEGLVGEVREMRKEIEDMRLILERLLGRKLRKVEGKVGEVKLEVGDLSREELRVVGLFWQWVVERWKEWERSYEEGHMEGYDRERDWVLLRRGTMQEFLDRAVDLGYGRAGVLKLLGDLGILRYWEKGGRRQYCIAVRITKPLRSAQAVSGYYVLMVKRMTEVFQELKRLAEAERKIERASVAGEAIGFQDGVAESEEGEVGQ